MMRILVCGARDWTDYNTILNVLTTIRNAGTEPGPMEITVIHGGAAGADSLAGKAAAELGLPVEVFPAQWDRYGRAAGPIRNQQMLDEGLPDLVIAFHPWIEKSKGTKDMLQRAVKRGVATRLIANAHDRIITPKESE